MTREEIIDNLELYTVGRPKKAQVFITVEELQNLIDEIKALEQEPVLDKIRAEITNIPTIETKGQYNWYREPQAIINDVLQIIDKAESEE